MPAYEKITRRFDFTGISLVPLDNLAPGKVGYAKNIRSYLNGEIRARLGYTNLGGALSGAVHSLFRLNNATPFTAVPALRVAASDANLYTAAVGNPYAFAEAGYSGEPLAAVAQTPTRSPEPYLYIADKNLLKKITSAGGISQTGITPPTSPDNEPRADVAQIGLNVVDAMDSTVNWVLAGTTAGAPAFGNRVNTTIDDIVYDSGATGYCSISPVDIGDIQVGIVLDLGGAAESVFVTDVLMPIASTDIAAIIYDSGNTGLCTIQPAASLGVGQLEAPPYAAYRLRAAHTAGARIAVPRGQAGVPPQTPTGEAVQRIRDVDFPVNALVRFNTGGGTEEVCRILSVALGPDGVQSFRCSTVFTHGAGDGIDGISSFRCYTQNTHAGGDTIQTGYIFNTITPDIPSGATSGPFVGGVKNTVLSSNLALINGRATLPDDDLQFFVRVDNLTEVEAIRIYLNTDATVDFLQNYYFFEWRANDILSAIQATEAAAVSTINDARQNVVINQQRDASVGAVPAGRATGRPEGPAPTTPPTTGSSVFMRRRQRLADKASPAVDDASGAGTAGYTGTGRRATAEQIDAMVNGQAVSANATSAQLALGNNQWILLKCKIKDLIQVGTDPSLTLKDVNGVLILLSGSGEDPIEASYDVITVTGGFGPDCGSTGIPYSFRYRYRSSSTGARSNPSPNSRGGVMPRRQRVQLTGDASADPQVDLNDWFVLGGSLTEWTYIGTSENGSTYNFDQEEAALAGGEALRFDLHRPWPVADAPAEGTCNVAGSAVEWVSGDTFDVNWAPGTILLVNGRACTLYASPASTTLLHINENAGSGTAVQFSIPSPLLQGVALPRLWGDVDGVYFSCGDERNPGVVYWTNPNDLDSTSDANQLVVSGGSEALQNGAMWDGLSYVFSTQNLYILQRDPINGFRAQITPCGRGLWAPWAMTPTPYGLAFLVEDGIAISAGGPAEYLTDPDLRAIFPHDGLPGLNVNGINAVDMTQPTRLRLAFVDGLLYFDYLDTSGNACTLVCDIPRRAWMFDQYANAVSCRYEEPGDGVHIHLLGCNGVVEQAGGTSDNGTAISWALQPSWEDAGDPRLNKLWGDVVISADPDGDAAGISVTPQYNNASVSLAAQFVGAGLSGRALYPIDLNDGEGVLAYNFGLYLQGSSVSATPKLYLWQPSFLAKADVTGKRATDWDDLGYAGAKYIQGVIIHADTLGNSRTVNVEYDGGTLALTLDVNQNGELEVAYPNAAAGWTPFIAHLVRLVPTDDNSWRFYGARWVFEPAPELATEWHTQPTSFDLPGYFSIRDIVVGYESSAPVTLTVSYDGAPQTYLFPSTSGGYARAYQTLRAGKGRSAEFVWTSDEPFRLYKRDIACRVEPWGGTQGYQVERPFGGPSREDGAAI